METSHGGPSAAPPLLQVDGVTLAFGGVRALSGVSFAVQPGSITAVIGPNGAGKTSLFNTISGFYRPTEGSIHFKGQAITRIHAPQRARMGLGRSFQNIALFRGMTVMDNIKLGRHAHLKTNVLDALSETPALVVTATIDAPLQANRERRSRARFQQPGRCGARDQARRKIQRG